MLKEQRREELYKLLGDLPEGNTKVASTLVGIEDRGNFLIEKLILDLNGIEPVPAYFIKPKTINTKSPVILYNHSHGGNYHVGKEEVLNSASYMFKTSYAEELTKCGYSVLCFDEWGFGERRGKSESEIFKEMLWKGKVMWGMMVYDSLRAIDYLTSREDVEAERIGTLGMSMGSTKAWWVAALETRVKVCVDICCMTDFHTLIDNGGLDGHGVYYYVPKLIKYFTTAQINALISPRPHLSLNGSLDKLAPEKGLDLINEELKKIYKEEGVEESFELKKYPVAHQENTEMRREVIKFFNKWL